VPPAPTPSFWRRHAAKLAASLVITVGLIYTIQKGGLKIVPESGDFTGVRWWGIALYLPFLAGVTWFRSVRWRFLLRRITVVPKRRLLAVSCAGFAAILLLPFRLGELARPLMLRTRADERREGAPTLTMTAATSSIVAERVIDGLFLSLVLAIVLVVVPTVLPLPDKVVGLPISVASVRASAFVLLGLFAAAFVAIAVFYFARPWAERFTRATIGRISPRLAEKLVSLFEKLSDGLHVFSNARDALGFLGETVAYWTCNAVGMWVLALGCGIHHADGTTITLPETCALLGMLGCAILIPGPPGMLGLFQAGIYAAMTMYYPTEIVTGPGAAYVFLLYAVQVVFTLISGAWGVWHEGGTRRLRADLEDAPAVAAQR
jgi:hypothetical protein